MKKLVLTAFLLLLATSVRAQPDPADSIILESKTVAPGHRGEADTSAYLYVKVYITNKDSLVFMVLSLKELTTSGGAYAILGRPRTFTGVINLLTPSFRYGSTIGLSRYDGSSPDSFVIGAGADVIDPNSIEPPNGVRKAVWEIKFDSVLNYAGTFELDSATVGSQPGCYFTDTRPVDLPVNFVKGIVTVPFSTVTPDPRDSIILESKTMQPGTGNPYTTVKVYITNKDSVGYMILALKELSTSGGAYGLLERTGSGNLTFSSVITTLTPTFSYYTAGNFSGYNRSSPDSFVVAAGCEPTELSTVEPPNATRKAVWEIKFDTVLSNEGSFELDRAQVGSNGTSFSIFSSNGLIDVPVNFVKSVIRVLVPDPRDSIILESKTVQPGSGRPYTAVKVYITNKDSLAFMTLALKVVSTSGGAYGLLSRTASGYLTFSSVVTTLTPTLRDFGVGNFNGYNSASPDTFLVAAGYDPGDLTSVEPPNITRKAVWEIKFDTVRSGVGTFELDSAVVLTHAGCNFSSWPPGADLPVNFVKSVVTIYPKGDFNQDLGMSGADIVILLNCIFGGEPAPGGVFCDVNCDGQPSAADIVLEVNAVFNLEPFPC